MCPHMERVRVCVLSPHVCSDRNLIAVSGPEASAVPNRENPPRLL